MKHIKKFEKISFDDELNDKISLSKYKYCFFVNNDFGKFNANLIFDIKKEKHITYDKQLKIDYIIKHIRFTENFNKILPTYCFNIDNTYSEKDFQKFIFLSPNNFYKEYPEKCLLIYNNLIDNVPTESNTDWYKQYYNDILNIFNSIPELKKLRYIKKYNL